MSTQAELAKLSVHEFAKRFRKDVIPVSNRFSYFSAIPLSEEDVRDYLQEPIAALPPHIQEALGAALVFLVPYLEKRTARTAELVTFDKPEERARGWAAQFVAGEECHLVFAIRDTEVAEYHYTFYRSVAALVVDRASEGGLAPFHRVLREELRATIHGEVDDESWKLKMQLLRRQSDARRDSKLFRAYARQSFIDTLTLYLHGLCCDIDVETGPRQLASRYLRTRLERLKEMFPPPRGYAVFPDESSS